MGDFGDMSMNTDSTYNNAASILLEIPNDVNSLNNKFDGLSEYVSYKLKIANLKNKTIG